MPPISASSRTDGRTVPPPAPAPAPPLFCSMRLAPLHGTAIPPNPIRWIDTVPTLHPTTAMVIFKNPVGLPMPVAVHAFVGREAESHCCAFDHCVSTFTISLRADSCGFCSVPWTNASPRGTVAHACNCKGQEPRSREPTPILPNYQVLPINQLRTYGGNNLTPQP